MFRGFFLTFECDNCGHQFKGPDIEWCATALTAPLKCPNCGSWHTCPARYMKSNKGGWLSRIFGGGYDKSIYEDIWKSQDELDREDSHADK